MGDLIQTEAVITEHGLVKCRSFQSPSKMTINQDNKVHGEKSLDCKKYSCIASWPLKVR